ncbi:hypothetical protein [Thalassotalea sp. G2M2-11]|uniref:hypothetical protein n=1 Tax=Thalassotalea sp. G2M2-11 TaxID=2787627 RepID=UPI0019D31AD1|nr:hypothetical protein [Thalassotalea sp. G2M2-11]
MDERFKAYWFTGLIVILSFITFIAMSTPTHRYLQCEIFAEHHQQNSHGIMLTYKVTNTSAQSLKLLSWYTPLEGFMSNLFEITDSQGKQLAYQGPMFKRVQPLEEDFIVIEANNSRSITLNLLDAYSLTAGHYQISLRPKVMQIELAQGSISKQQCLLPSINITVDA